jgi:hypothetical protein
MIVGKAPQFRYDFDDIVLKPANGTNPISGIKNKRKKSIFDAWCTQYDDQKIEFLLKLQTRSQKHAKTNPTRNWLRTACFSVGGDSSMPRVSALPPFVMAGPKAEEDDVDDDDEESTLPSFVALSPDDDDDDGATRSASAWLTETSHHRGESK